MRKYIKINKDNIIQGIIIAVVAIFVVSMIAGLLRGSAVVFIEALGNMTFFTAILFTLTSLIFALMKWLEATE